MGQEVLMFHSALGLGPAIHEFAARLREAGHVVHTSDSFDGEVFQDLTDGIRKRDALGIPELMTRAEAAASELPSEIVYMGFSMGTGAAESLAATRPGARGAILVHGALAPAAIGLERWPTVPVQLHYARNDPFVDVGQVQALEEAVRASDVAVDVHAYEGVSHLFEDPALPGHDEKATDAMLKRVLMFLSAIDRELQDSKS